MHLFIIQAGLGLALSLCNPTWYALFDKYSTKNSEGTIWGLSDGEGKILTGIAIILGGLIVKHLSFDVLFIIMGCTHVVATLYQSQLLIKKRR
jgi:MFS family permease